MEFALVAPILFALVFGIFDFGRAMSANVTVTNSAREGARWAATHATSMTTTGSASGPDARFGFECPTGTSPTVVLANGPTAEAWRQLQSANLDLTKVMMTVSYYHHDPTSNAADDVQSCGAYGKPGYGQASESNATGAGAYSPATGDWVKVDVQYTYSPVTPFISALIPSVTVDQSSTMVLE